jgi:cell division transport system permease protein
MKNRKLIAAERIVKNGAVNFGRNVWLAVAAIAMMSITLTILLFAFVSNITFSHTVDNLTSHIDVKVYLKDSITPDQKDKLLKSLKSAPNVASVSYISKAQALRDYRAANASNTDLLSAISETDNPLPANILIKPADPNKLDDIKSYLDSSNLNSQIDSVSYSGDRKKAIDNITHSTHFFQEAGVVGIVIFVIISVLIIFNTIRMAIFNRRDELIIMRLLGASTAFIRGPFVVETMMYGAVAAAISLIVCASLFKLAGSTLQGAGSLNLLDIGYSSTYFSNHLAEILTGQIAIGILIGAASSALATRRYLKLNTKN